MEVEPATVATAHSSRTNSVRRMWPHARTARLLGKKFRPQECALCRTWAMATCTVTLEIVA